MDKQRIIELAQELASVPDTDTGYTKHYILEDIENELNEKLDDKNMRILKGYSKDQQKELEEARKNMSCNDFLHSITYFPATIECDSIKDKYDEADTDERISIIRDILDFYCGDAKFPEQKYYVHFIKDNRYSYLTITPNGVLGLGSCLEIGSWKTKFTREEIIAMNPQLLPFMEEVEE